MEFIASNQLHGASNTVPYFEDSSKLEVPGRGTEKSVDKLMEEVRAALQKLGAGYVLFQEGKYQEGKVSRTGFQITFNLNGVPGRMDCAALPLRSWTRNKERAALTQALYLLRDKLNAVYYASMYEPGSVPLLPYLLGSNGKTVTESLIASGMLPQLTAGGQFKSE